MMYPQNDNGSYRPCGLYDPRVREWFMTITEEKQKIVVLVDTSCSMLNHSASTLIVDLIEKLHDFEMKGWEEASRHYLGAGIELGIPLLAADLAMRSAWSLPTA